MKMSELTKKSPSDLEKLLSSLRKSTVELRFSLKSGKVKNVRELRIKRREIAQVLTVLNQASETKDSEVKDATK